ncbi:MAG: hypothetical protein IJ109_00860 [Firmicutes bacterium]|nr:hypothetical protein [Bacillota bacterium]
MITKQEIRKETALIMSLKHRFSERLDKLPPGVLYLKMSHGKRRPHQRVDGREIYLSRKNTAIVQGLKDKKELDRSLKKLEQNLDILEKLQAQYTEIPDLMPAGMSLSSQTKGPLQKVAPMLSRDSIAEIASRWRTEHNGNTDYRPEERIHRTSDGICVRSKSELAIYEYLKSHGISFVYELPLQLGDHLRYPDFTLIRRSDGKVFLWEHLGMMSDPSYYRSNINKIYEYMAENYLPDRDMLFSYDYEDGSIDLLEVDRMLRGFGFIE